MLRLSNPQPAGSVWHLLNPFLSGLRLFVFYLVLSEIHSSLTSSFSLGSTLITSPPLVLTTMLLPTASNTSIDSVFLQRQQRMKLKKTMTESDTKMNTLTNQYDFNCWIASGSWSLYMYATVTALILYGDSTFVHQLNWGIKPFSHLVSHGRAVKA